MVEDPRSAEGGQGLNGDVEQPQTISLDEAGEIAAEVQS